MEDMQVGQLVRSIAGRDKGKFYLIYDVLDEAFVRVIDGEKRKLINPKKKNIKHLEFIQNGTEDVSERLRNRETASDGEILKAIKSLG